MCLSERPCCGHISAPEIKNPYRESTTRWFQHYTSACIPTLLSLAQRGLVDEMWSTPAAQIQESSQVGKRHVHHARLEERHWTICSRKSAGCIEGTFLAKRCGSLRTPHHADTEVSHETCHH